MGGGADVKVPNPISVLLPCNSSATNLAASNSTHLSSHSFCRQGVWTQLSWVLCQVSAAMCCHVMWKLDLGTTAHSSCWQFVSLRLQD